MFDDLYFTSWLLQVLSVKTDWISSSKLLIVWMSNKLAKVDNLALSKNHESIEVIKNSGKS